MANAVPRLDQTTNRPVLNVVGYEPTRSTIPSYCQPQKLNAYTTICSRQAQHSSVADHSGGGSDVGYNFKREKAACQRITGEGGDPYKFPKTVVQTYGWAHMVKNREHWNTYPLTGPPACLGRVGQRHQDARPKHERRGNYNRREATVNGNVVERKTVTRTSAPTVQGVQ